LPWESKAIVETLLRGSFCTEISLSLLSVYCHFELSGCTLVVTLPTVEKKFRVGLAFWSAANRLRANTYLAQGDKAEAKGYARKAVGAATGEYAAQLIRTRTLACLLAG
jgi:hypothetical protein